MRRSVFTKVPTKRCGVTSGVGFQVLAGSIGGLGPAEVEAFTADPCGTPGKPDASGANPDQECGELDPTVLGLPGTVSRIGGGDYPAAFLSVKRPPQNP